MAEVRPLTLDAVGFMEAYLPPKKSSASGDLPFVTLTYASSLDGMIALHPGARTTLSGPESKSMTHYLRMRHDAILVGASTAVVDDPALNCRYPGAEINDQPRPIIVDPNGRYIPDGMKAYTLSQHGAGKAPWIVAHSADSSPEKPECQIDELHLLKKSVPDTRGIPWQCILETLKKKGINSVMIEGGANVINSLLRLPNLVDRVIITIAPTFLGQGAVAIAPRNRPGDNTNVDNAAWIDHNAWRQFGQDMVLFGSLRRPPVYQ